jgi:ribosomal protein S18 acetylase RimI-like enzyme
VIRAAAPGDLAAVLALWRSAGSVPSVTDRADALAALLSHDPGALLVAVEDGTLVGSLVVGWDGWRGGFYRLAVAPGVQRRGLATALVRAGEARLRALGAERISVIVDADAGGARAFWAAAGYAFQPERARYVRSLTSQPPPAPL